MLICCGGPLTIVQAVLNGFADNLRPTGDNESSSVTDARRREVLVGEWEVEPPVMDVPGGRLTFGDAWVEERSRSTHRLVWFPAEERTGGYRLQVCFEFQAGAGAVGVPAELMLVSDDHGVGYSINGAGLDKQRMYTQLIDDPNVTGLRLSVVESFHVPRAKDIRLVPKKR
jgi:hypothetical protein